MTTQASGTGPDDGQSSQPQPVYDSVEAWVTGQFLSMYRRPIGGEYRWCRQWWQHAEAITRLTALWHSWEALRLEPGTGMAIWLRDHLDHQLSVLLGRGGPSPSAARTSTLSPGKPGPRTRRPDGGRSATTRPRRHRWTAGGDDGDAFIAGTSDVWRCQSFCNISVRPSGYVRNAKRRGLWRAVR